MTGTGITYQISALAMIWLALIIWCVRDVARSRSGSVGLPFAFLYSMTFQYCGFLAYLVPGYSHMRPGGSLYLQGYNFSEDTVLLGVTASVIGVAGFALGCRLQGRSRIAAESAARRAAVDPGGTMSSKALTVLLAFGATGFLIGRLPFDIPMGQAIGQVGRNAAVAAVCLGAYLSWRSGRSYWPWLLLAALIPMVYLVGSGFTSYGFIVLTIFASFWLFNLKPERWRGLRLNVGIWLASYGLLTLFVTWMSFREQLRQVLWGEAGLSDRLSAIGFALSQAELLSPWNFQSLDWINGRLNQYIFVGKMMEFHALIPELRRYGETIFMAALAWIPRVLWPGKPELGGSQFVATNTGMVFSQGTTFGSGPVFEFYVNLGYAGVFVGFIALGYFVRMVDRRAAIDLHQGRMFNFARWFVVGIPFISPLTDFFFLVNTAAISWLVLSALKFLFLRQTHSVANNLRLNAARPPR